MVGDEQDRLSRRRPALWARARVLSATRRWFERQGFLEVDTPARVHSPGQELHLDAIASEDRWLVTSPEYAMKRLCGAGYERIFSIGKCWRAGEKGPHHQPEFTMVEWYRADAPLETIALDCEELVRGAAAAAVDLPGTAAGGRADSSPPPRFAGPFRRTTVRALVREWAGFDLRGDESAEELAARAAAAGVRVGGARRWDDIFFQLWLDRVEPALATMIEPVFVFDWPAPLGALARRHPADPRIVERFELYAGGLELANAFGELTDADEQRARFTAESTARQARGAVTYPVDEKLLAALPRMKPTSGVALGFDRLMMLVLGVASIRDVMAFAHDEI